MATYTQETCLSSQPSQKQTQLEQKKNCDFQDKTQLKHRICGRLAA